MSDQKDRAQPIETVVGTEIEHVPTHGDTQHVVGFETSSTALPKGYFFTTSFVGTILAAGLGLNAAVAGYGLPAPVLGIIDADIGPDPDLIWVALGYSLTLTVGVALFGRITDIFGRRWSCIGGQALSLIGSIICATAQSIHQLIAGSSIIGIGSVAAYSFPVTIGELVPMRFRFRAVAIMFIFCIPGSGFAPLISNAMIAQTKVGWRGLYYYLIAINAVSTLGWLVFYHPPTFHMKQGNHSKLELAKKLDYGGILLYTAGLLLLLLGLSWGGSVYPWKSGYVIGTVVAGGLSLIALGYYEIYMPLEQPLVPTHLFRNIPWLASTILLGLGAGVYYALAIVWPSYVSLAYANGDTIYGGLVSSLHGCSIIFGQLVGGTFANPIGKIKYQAFVTYTIGGVFLACLATTTPDTKARAVGLLFSACFCIGWVDMLTLGLITLACNDQRDIGAAGGFGSSIRGGLGTVATAIYTSVLSTRLKVTIPAQVPPAVVAAGLPESRVPDFLADIATGNFTNIPNITASIIEAGVNAYKGASVDAFHTVFLTTLAFTGLGLICCFWVPNIEARMTDEVVTTLHERNTDHVVGEKAV